MQLDERWPDGTRERLREAIRSLVAQMQRDRKAKTYTVRHGDAVLASGVAYDVAVDVAVGYLIAGRHDVLRSALTHGSAPHA